MKEQSYEEWCNEVITAYIYHVDGIKVGCTNNFSRRQKCIRSQHKDFTIELELIEEVTAPRNQVADIEDYWHQKHGYGAIKDTERYDSKGLWLAQTPDVLDRQRSSHSSAMQDPETRAKQRAAMQDPELRARLSDAAKKNSTPEETSAKMVKYWSDPKSHEARNATTAKSAIWVSFDGSEKRRWSATRAWEWNQANSIVITFSENTRLKSIQTFKRNFNKHLHKCTIIYPTTTS